ncbi:GNAT family N-acetyltransferase [Chloroflexota bacterium]
MASTIDGIRTAIDIPTATEKMMSEGLTFRKAEKEDLPRISGFRKALFEHNPSIKSHEPEYYEWKCYQNPILPGEIWLAEDGDMLVGMKSMIPKMIKILGKVLEAAETGDTFTHPNYQRRGIFTALFKDARKCGLDSRIGFIYGTPNRKSLPGYEKKLDYAQVPIKLHGLLKPLHPKQLLKTKLHYSPLASILSPIVEIVSRAIFRIGVKGIARTGVFVYTEPAFPDDIDALWEQVSKDYDIILTRTKSYLEWRYVTNPDTYSILIARDREGIISGYMVIKSGFSENTPIGFICDYLTFEGDPNIFKTLLAVAVKELEGKKASVIYTWAVKGNFYYKVLLRLGFFPSSQVPIVCYKNELGNKVLSRAYKWHFTMGDTDNI